MADKPLPRAIREATFTLYGVPVRCVVLDTGQRVINAEDFDRLMMAISDSGESDRDYEPGDVVAFHAWRHGIH